MSADSRSSERISRNQQVRILSVYPCSYVQSKQKNLTRVCAFRTKAFKNSWTDNVITNVKKNFPTNRLGSFLSKIGLGSILTRIIIASILISLIYLVFIPNFLFVKIIQINGITQPERSFAQKLLNLI